MATDTPPTDAGERRRSVDRSSPEVPFSGFYSRANAAAERRAAAARNAIIERSDWISDSHPTRRTRLRTRHYGSFLRKRFYRGSLLRAEASGCMLAWSLTCICCTRVRVSGILFFLSKSPCTLLVTEEPGGCIGSSPAWCC